MATTVDVHEAKTQLTQLLVRVSMGEEVVIAKAGIGDVGSKRTSGLLGTEVSRQ